MRYQDITANDPATIIMQELGKTGLTPEECNDGWCGYLADKIVSRLGGEVLTTDEGAPDEWRGKDSRHEWVHYNGKHYDAETPYGVQHPRDLGYFRRQNGQSMPPTNYEPDLNRDDED